VAVAIVATAGAANANSFGTEADFATWIDERLNVDAYTTASADTRRRALVQATRELSALSWIGTPASDTQALSWPRDDAINPDVPDGVDGLPQEYDDDEIPARIERATFELALQFLKAGTTDLLVEDPTLHLVRRKVDVIEMEWAEPHQRARGLGRFYAVLREIEPLLASAGNEVVRS
jgi:hypothetical protein